jgi:microcystin degradation protein MlrC
MPTPFRAVGAEPADYRVVIVKSAQHFYNGFVGLAKEILYVASPGACRSRRHALALHQAQDAVLAQGRRSVEMTVITRA